MILQVSSAPLIEPVLSGVNSSDDVVAESQTDERVGQSSGEAQGGQSISSTLRNPRSACQLVDQSRPGRIGSLLRGTMVHSRWDAL